jgi:uncharacterized protein YmfQ (DUF2313 family)
MFKVFQHVLPNARAWRLTIDKKLRQLFVGLGEAAQSVREFFNRVFADVFPQTTRSLAEWEDQFGLPDSGLTEQQRRDRLDASWKAVGAQDPAYIQATLRGAGFDVYVHEWWEPGTEPNVGEHACATPRNPLMWLRREFTGVTLLVECGEPSALCGEAFAESGNSLEPRGYPLVNKIYESTPDWLTLCGEELAECGEVEASCGNYVAFRESLRDYIVPRDPAKWPYFLYIGGGTFGDIAQIDPRRKDEFEALCLKISPAQQWLGILVEYN